MTDTFTWAPRFGSQGRADFRVRKAQFGDGYVQSVPDGINPIVGSHPLSFVGRAATVTAIRDFLEAHIGKSFFWTPALGVQGYYQCDGYDLIREEAKDAYTLNATFQQVFRP